MRTAALPHPSFGVATDPLEDPDPVRVADTATTENLLRCWVRETGLTEPADGVLRIDLPSSGTTIEAELRHWSAAGWHRFDAVRLSAGGVTTGPADTSTVASLLAREAAARAGGQPHQTIDLVGRVLDSARRVATFVGARRSEVAETRPAQAPSGRTPFLAGEQALLLGHPLHPTSKSRVGLSEAETRAFSPELRGSFPLHWFAADPDVVASDSALEWSAGDIVAGLASSTESSAGGLDVPPGMIAVPAHPWQARDLLGRPGIASLLGSGALRYLGPAGPAWYPTSSVRTLYRPDAPVMLKLSLGLRITNSRRENLRKELIRGVEVHRLMEAGIADSLHAAHPGFDIVRDPAWLAVGHDGLGLDVLVRENPFSSDVDACCVAGLIAELPGIGPSRLGSLVSGLAQRSGSSVAEAAVEWFKRYIDSVAAPVLWLYASYGVALEAHQQNTVVVLDSDGWPAGGRYRDNQGYYFAASRVDDLSRLVPGAGVESDTTVPDEVAEERLGYYLGINNLLGLVGGFGSQGLADEAQLLDVLRSRLESLRSSLSMAATAVPRTLSVLLDAPILACKANLLTRLFGMDELVGPVSSQSVYVGIRNPLLGARG